VCISVLLSRTTCPARVIIRDELNNIWLEVQIIFFQPSVIFSLRPNYLPQQSSFERTQSMLFTTCGTKFYTHVKQQAKYKYTCFNMYLLMYVIITDFKNYNLWHWVPPMPRRSYRDSWKYRLV
jgi:hypothetical protein